MVFGTVEHICIPMVSTESYRLNVLALPTNALYKLHLLKKSGTFFDFINGRFAFNKETRFSPAVCATMSLNEKENLFSLNCNASIHKRFGIFIAVLSKNARPTIGLRIAVTKHGVRFMKTQENFVVDGDKLVLPPKYNRNTAYVIGIEANSDQLMLELNTKESHHLIAWNESTGFDMIDQGSFAMDTACHHTETPCLNCGKNHDISVCEYPWYSVHCTGCLVVSINAKFHTKPCKPINKISLIRSNIFAEVALPLYDLSWQNSDGTMHCLIDGQFHPVRSGQQLVSAPAEALIEFDEMNSRMRFKQCSFKRCSVLIAIKINPNVWRIRFSAVVTPKDGLLVFKLTSTLHNGTIPASYLDQTVAVLGFIPKEDSFYMKFDVHAMAGIYNGHIGWSDASTSNQEAWHIDDSLKEFSGTGINQRQKRFHNTLFKPEPAAVSTFKGQSAHNLNRVV